mmetsp:Transcript_24645/g.23668  ORF Transcript_24645/g.23668 Transcript_24645/m.23668 type:complete len:264 (-) Transcript_24645:64-855(-)
MIKMALFQLVCTILLIVTSYTQAFTSHRTNNRHFSIHKGNSLPTAPRTESSLIAFAKKRRRRKDSQINKDVMESPKSEVLENDDENALPEFDLNEDVDIFTSTTKQKSSPMDMSDPKVLEAMKGTSKVRGVRATNNLVKDRDLEKRFQFDSSEVKDQSLPTNLAGVGKNTERKIGKKAARTEARKSAAIEAKQVEEESESFLSKLSIGQVDGEFNYVKFVEQGTWFSIYALVGWEIYINTPLFDRAGTLSPVVFESPSQIFLI